LGWKPGKSTKFRPILATQETLTDFHGDEANKIFIFLKRNFKMAATKKTEFFTSTNSQYFFLKISWVGPWVSRID
jgi:hypothetical protein